MCFLQHLRPAPFTALQRTGIDICSPACSVVTEPRPIVGCSSLLVVALLIHTFISLRLSVSVSILVSVTKGRVPGSLVRDPGGPASFLHAVAYNLGATTETPVKIGDVQEPVVALVDHGSEINLMSMDFYKKGKWPINTKHGWKIRAATRATEELHGACPNVRVKIGDVEIDQHFFVQETLS